MAHKASKEVADKIQAFEEADKAFKESYDAFETAYSKELKYLDQLREIRNTALDEAKRSMREEADTNTDEKTKFISVGRFSATKKESIFYLTEKFVAMLHARELYDLAIAANVVRVTTTVPYTEAKAFLTKQGIETEFEECEDGAPMTTAVTCPKPIPAFGSETKGK